jgi:HSP20 family molecular chaperone IbpA
METQIPIHEPLQGFHGFGHWNRHREAFPLLDWWGRHGIQQSGSRTRHGHSGGVVMRSTVPEILQHGWGDMHLDDWISPNELIGSIMEDEKIMKDVGFEDKAPAVVAKPKQGFEVKLNVTDYKPTEVHVKICNGLVTIQGKHEEDTKLEHDREGHEVGGRGHISKNFKRTFTLPRNVLDDQMKCHLTEDGHLVICAPVSPTRQAPAQKAHGKIAIMQDGPVCKEKMEHLEQAPKNRA